MVEAGCILITGLGESKRRPLRTIGSANNRLYFGRRVLSVIVFSKVAQLEQPLPNLAHRQTHHRIEITLDALEQYHA